MVSTAIQIITVLMIIHNFVDIINAQGKKKIIIITKSINYVII